MIKILCIFIHIWYGQHQAITCPNEDQYQWYKMVSPGHMELISVTALSENSR